MSGSADKDYIAVVQCDLVQRRCSGYRCDMAFERRSGGFARYPEEKSIRTLHMTCGGCPGRSLHVKLGNFIRQARKQEGIEKGRIVVHLSSCITKDNFHGPPCPHLDYLKTVVGKRGLDLVEDTVISELSERRRAEGVYCASHGNEDSK